MSAILTHGLSKRYGDVAALDDLDLRSSRARSRLPGPERRRQDDDDPPAARVDRPTSGRAELFGVDAWSDPAGAHRRSRTSPASRSCGRR